MGNWTITVAQLPIPGSGQFHNMILIRDDAGRIHSEINGGPVDPTTGDLILFGSHDAFQAGTAYLSGQYPVGAKISQQKLYQAGLPESQPLFSGTSLRF